MITNSRCGECFRVVGDRPDSLCSGRQHVGQSQPAPWGPK